MACDFGNGAEREAADVKHRLGKGRLRVGVAELVRGRSAGAGHQQKPAGCQRKVVRRAIMSRGTDRRPVCDSIPAETIEAAKASLSGCQTRLKMPIAERLRADRKPKATGGLAVCV